MDATIQKPASDILSVTRIVRDFFFLFYFARLTILLYHLGMPPKNCINIRDMEWVDKKALGLRRGMFIFPFLHVNVFLNVHTE